MKKFHDTLKIIYVSNSSGAITLLSADEALSSQITMHNRPSSSNDKAIDRPPQIEYNVNCHGNKKSI